eukprot:sb/3469276/
MRPLKLVAFDRKLIAKQTRETGPICNCIRFVAKDYKLSSNILENTREVCLSTGRSMLTNFLLTDKLLGYFPVNLDQFEASGNKRDVNRSSGSNRHNNPVKCLDEIETIYVLIIMGLHTTPSHLIRGCEPIQHREIFMFLQLGTSILYPNVRLAILYNTVLTNFSMSYGHLNGTHPSPKITGHAKTEGPFGDIDTWCDPPTHVSAQPQKGSFLSRDVARDPLDRFSSGLSQKTTN